MRVGCVAEPTAWKPAPEAISILDRPWLYEEAAAPICSCFWTLVSLEAAIKAKSARSPLLAAVPPMARWNWTGLPQSALLLGAIVQGGPVGEEPVTNQLPAEEGRMISRLTGLASETALTVKLPVASAPCITLRFRNVEA